MDNLLAEPIDIESDIGEQLKAERIFEILTQMVLDVCTHISSKTNLSPSPTYADCMRALGDNSIITESLKEKLVSMVK